MGMRTDMPVGMGISECLSLYMITNNISRKLLTNLFHTIGHITHL